MADPEHISHNEEASVVLDAGDVTYTITAPCGPIMLTIERAEQMEKEQSDEDLD